MVYRQMSTEALLQPYKSPEAAAIPDRYKDPEGWRTGSDDATALFHAATTASGTAASANQR
jgi:ABC-type Fe3+ transport system substrate-binding protein